MLRFKLSLLIGTKKLTRSMKFFAILLYLLPYISICQQSNQSTAAESIIVYSVQFEMQDDKVTTLSYIPEVGGLLCQRVPNACESVKVERLTGAILELVFETSKVVSYRDLMTWYEEFPFDILSLKYFDKE